MGVSLEAARCMIAISDKTEPMKRKCPASTPMLKI
jgi:hypothetical protein